jgi:hypothetical protein
MLAAWFGHTEVVRILLAAGANIEAIDNEYGFTALMIAAYGGHAEVVNLLLHKGAKFTFAAMQTFANVQVVDFTKRQAVIEKLTHYTSQQDNQTGALAVLVLLASYTIIAIGILALLGINCSVSFCFPVAIVSCVSSLVYSTVLSKQNNQRQERKTNHADKPSIALQRKTYLNILLDILINIAPAACVMLHMLPVLCPPLLLVAIGIMSIILLDRSFDNRIQNDTLPLLANYKPS